MTAAAIDAVIEFWHIRIDGPMIFGAVCSMPLVLLFAAAISTWSRV